MSLPDNSAQNSDGRKILLGVDGGGTKTAFLLARSDGHVIGYHRGRGSHHPDIGIGGVEDVLSDGITAVLGGAGLSSDRLDGVFFGIPAFGAHPQMDKKIVDLAQQLLGHDRFIIENDMLCGWAGSLAAQDGINIVAGTGSIGYGERKGRKFRCGGWGTLVGDEGSAYWIAKEGLSLFTKMSDGRAARGPLYDIFRSHFDLEDDLSLCAYLETTALDRAALASLAPFVSQAARGGDMAAKQVMTIAAKELALICRALATQLDYVPEEPVRVSYSGGVFGPKSSVASLFKSALDTEPFNFVLQEPLADPTTGAVLLAARCAGVAPTLDLCQKLADGACLAA